MSLFPNDILILKQGELIPVKDLIEILQQHGEGVVGILVKEKKTHGPIGLYVSKPRY